MGSTLLSKLWLGAASLLFVACAAVSPNEKMSWPQSADHPIASRPWPGPGSSRTDSPVAPAPQFSLEALRWPLFARAITSYFGFRVDPIETNETRFHRGLDLAAHYGAVVYAAASGQVLIGGWQGGRGNYVAINHGQGVRTGYSHLSQLLVESGMWVKEGQPIGLVGESGRATGPHLHFEVIVDDQPVDPLPLLGGQLPTEAQQARVETPAQLITSR